MDPLASMKQAMNNHIPFQNAFLIRRLCLTVPGIVSIPKAEECDSAGDATQLLQHVGRSKGQLDQDESASKSIATTTTTTRHPTVCEELAEENNIPWLLNGLLAA